MFALITAETARRGEDVTAGLIAAISWIGDHLPVYALNLVLSTATDLWALRYPATHELWVLQRPSGGTATSRGLDARTDRIHARSEGLAERPGVIIASEPMDGDPGWRLLGSGELLHVNRDLGVVASRPFRDRPAHQLGLDELTAAAAASQQATA